MFRGFLFGGILVSSSLQWRSLTPYKVNDVIHFRKAIGSFKAGYWICRRDHESRGTLSNERGFWSHMPMPGVKRMHRKRLKRLDRKQQKVLSMLPVMAGS